MCGVCMCTVKCSCEFLCSVVSTALRTHLVRSRPNLDSCSLWTGYTGDSKTDLWDDPKVRTSSCNEDQTSIRIQNCIISCECLFIGLFQLLHFILLFHTSIHIILHYFVHTGNYCYIMILWYFLLIYRYSVTNTVIVLFLTL